MEIDVRPRSHASALQAQAHAVIAAENIYRASVQVEIPFASYRLPNAADTTTLVQFSKTLSPLALHSESDIKGFAFAPFDLTGNSRSILIAPDLFFQGQRVSSSAVFSAAKNYSLGAEFLRALSANAADLCSPKFLYRDKAVRSASKETYCTGVATAQAAMQAGAFRKVVLSRSETSPLPDAFNAFEFFTALCKAYPHAFVSLVSLPGIGTWIGATPEVLLRADEKNLETVALAGTHKLSAGEDADLFVWGSKERDEQQVVTDYITARFFSTGLSAEVSEPETLVAGNVIHLRTQIRSTVGSAESQVWKKVAMALHPTPAVCGYPQAEAKAFIAQHEGYDRSYYTGFLGSIGLDSNTGLEGTASLFVNLRCVELLRTEAVFYAGAGITLGSQPEAEWNETAFKMETLRSVMLKTK